MDFVILVAVVAARSIHKSDSRASLVSDRLRRSHRPRPISTAEAPSRYPVLIHFGAAATVSVGGRFLITKVVPLVARRERPSDRTVASRGNPAVPQLEDGD